METEPRTEASYSGLERERELSARPPLPTERAILIEHLRRQEAEHVTRDLAKVNEKMEVVEEENRRQEFKTQATDFLDDPVDDYIRHVHCHDSGPAYQTYQQSVDQYLEQGRLKRLFSRSPEIGSHPWRYKVARLIELYRDTVATDTNEPLRILYPASGADVAGLLRSIALLDKKNIELILVNRGHSQTGGPGDIVKRLERAAPNIKTDVQVKYLSEYVDENPKPVDVFLYHTPSLSRHLSIGDQIFEGVDLEKFDKMLGDRTLMIGDHKGMEHLVKQHKADEFLREEFEPIDARFPASLRRSQKGEALGRAA